MTNHDLKIQEKSLILNGKKVHYLEGGKGDTLLLIHGWLGSSNGFIYVLPVLAEKFHVIVPDLPGCGFTKSSSEELEKVHSIQNYSAFLNSFIQKLKLGKVSLVGVSMGGNIILDFAARYPREAPNLIVFEPYFGSGILFPFGKLLSIISSFEFIRPLLRWLVVQIIKTDRSFRMLSRDDKKAIIAEIYGGSLKAASESAKDLLRQDVSGFKNIKAKGLFIIGGVKNYFISKKKMRIQHLIPNIKITEVPSASHNFIREDPKKFSRLVIDFLENK